MKMPIVTPVQHMLQVFISLYYNRKTIDKQASSLLIVGFPRTLVHPSFFSSNMCGASCVYPWMKSLDRFNLEEAARANVRRNDMPMAAL